MRTNTLTNATLGIGLLAAACAAACGGGCAAGSGASAIDDDACEALATDPARSPESAAMRQRVRRCGCPQWCAPDRRMRTRGQLGPWLTTKGSPVRGASAPMHEEARDVVVPWGRA